METLLPLAMFAFVSSITPGPNNIMLASSGVVFGLYRTVPHMVGVTMGFGSMLALCAMGVDSLAVAWPELQTALKMMSSAYLLYLAWQLRRLSFRPDSEQRLRPMSMIGAAGFQFINPKAWMMAVTGASAFLPPVEPVGVAVLVLCGVSCLINFFCIGMWAGMGAVLRRYLVQPSWRRGFAGVMVGLTAYAALAIWL